MIRSALLSTLLLSLAVSPGEHFAQDDGLDLDIIIELLAETEDDEIRLELLAGLREGLAGRKKVSMPQTWPTAYPNLAKSSSAKVRDAALAVALIFDDPAALKTLRIRLEDKKASTSSRLDALRALVGKRAAGLTEPLHKLLSETALRRHALRSLAAFVDAKTPAAILAHYRQFDAGAKHDAISTLSARPAYALALLDAVSKKIVARSEVSAIHARQIEALGNEKALARLREVWGDIRKTSADKRAAIEKYKKILRPGFVAKGNLSHGRELFEKTCAKCHELYDVGESIGPELTGSNRADLDYILENILDPSAAIGKGYRLTTVITRDGRAISGIIRERVSNRIKIRTESDLVTIAEEDAISVTESEKSMMPDGLLTNISNEHVRDLIAYLATKKQVPLERNE